MYRDQIRQIYPHLSPGYRRVANFLLEKYREAAFMTAAQIGRAADVDTTLVVRFAQRLGYPGYPELIGEIQEEVKLDLRALYRPLADETAAPAIVERVLNQDRNNLEYMLIHNDPQTIERVVEIIVRASHIVLVGEGNSHFIAEAFALRLAAMGRNAQAMLNEPLGQSAMISNLKPGDVLIGLGLTPLTPSVAIALKLARAQGISTVGIVGAFSNPVAATAEHILIAPVMSLGMLPSLTGCAALLHALDEAVAQRLGDGMADWAMRTDYLMRQYVETLSADIPNVIEAIEAYNRMRNRKSAQAEPTRPGA
jgi:DNA-binding MurR/RpiR family transcriptional regulator